MTAIVLETSLEARLRAREQLTEQEAEQLRAMLSRTAASTVIAALALLCGDKRAESLGNNDTCSARHWDDTATALWLEARQAFRRFGVGHSG